MTRVAAFGYGDSPSEVGWFDRSPSVSKLRRSSRSPRDGRGGKPDIRRASVARGEETPGRLPERLVPCARVVRDAASPEVEWKVP